MVRRSSARLVSASAISIAALILGSGGGCAFALDGFSGSEQTDGAVAVDAADGSVGEPDGPMADVSDAATATVLAIDPVVVVTGGSYDLTKLGALDWAQWTMGSSYSRCASCTARLGVIAATAAVQSYTTDPRTFTWTNGAPVASDSSTSGLFIEGQGKHFSLSVVARPNPAALTLYLDTYHAGGVLTAQLDGTTPMSRATVVDATSGTSYLSFTIHFAAATGSTLLVEWELTTDLLAGNDSGDSGNIAAIAASLAPDP